MGGYTEQRLIPFPSFLFPYFFEQWSSLHLFFISRNAFSLINYVDWYMFKQWIPGSLFPQPPKKEMEAGFEGNVSQALPTQFFQLEMKMVI